MPLFDVNWRTLARLLLPTKLRGDKMLALVVSVLAGFKSIHSRFLAFRTGNLYRIQHGQHVAHLEAVLNDAFDPALRRIYITDADVLYDPVHLYQSAEQQPLYIYQPSETQPVWIYTQFEIDFMGEDFIVHVPIGVPVDEGRLAALVEYYKTPGKAWAKQTF